MQDEIDKLDKEIALLKAEYDRARILATDVFARRKAIHDAIRELKIQKILGGDDGQNYDQLIADHERLLDEENAASQDMVNLEGALMERRDKVNHLKSQLRTHNKAKAQKWLVDHEQKYEDAAVTALLNFQAAMHLKHNMKPAMDAMLKRLLYENDKQYQLVLSDMRKQAGVMA